MSSEEFKIYISSNSVNPTRVLRVSRTMMNSGIVVVSIGFVLVVSCLFDYVGLKIQKPQYNHVRTEHQYLLSNLQFVESELGSLEKQVESVEQLSDKIEVIKEYYNQGPASTMSTPTEYFTVDYVATGTPLKREPNSIEQHSEKALLTKTQHILPNPLIEEVTQEEDFVIDRMSNRIELAVQNTQILERKVMQLWENLSERQNFLRATPSVSPARGWFSSRFGVRADPYTGRPTMHSGLDIAGRYGTTVVATADGVVTYVGYQNGYGQIVTIDHGYGIKTRYAHNSKILVNVGDKVNRYDPVSRIGSSGRSTGPHVHYEVRVRGVAVDPINYILNY